MKREKSLWIYLQQVMCSNVSGFALEHGMSYPACAPNSIVDPRLFCDLCGAARCGSYATETVVLTSTFPLIAFE